MRKEDSLPGENGEDLTPDNGGLSLEEEVEIYLNPEEFGVPPYSIDTIGDSIYGDYYGSQGTHTSGGALREQTDADYNG